MKSKVSLDDINRFKATIKKEKDLLDKKLTKDTEIEVYVQAIYLGYLDAARTFGGQEKVKKDNPKIESIAKKMKEYIDGSKNDFDSMFYEVCKIQRDGYKMKFGQAQKIINMAFKYLYCIADDGIEERFDKCHMPLDGIMLEWIHRNVTDEQNKKLKKVNTWSGLKEGSEDEAGTYRYYKKHVDEYCKENNKTALQLDFEYWVDMSQTLAAESYLKTFTEDEKKRKKHIDLLKKCLANEKNERK